jgi:hypothetical protein
MKTVFFFFLAFMFFLNFSDIYSQQYNPFQTRKPDTTQVKETKQNERIDTIFTNPTTTQKTQQSTIDNFYAQQSNESFYSRNDTIKFTNLYDFGLGLKLSTISGYGLVFSARFLETMQISLTGFMEFSDYVRWSDMSKSKEVENRKDNLYDFGVELRNNMFTSKKVNIYLLLGGYFSKVDEQQNINDSQYTTTYTGGLGFGIEWFWSEYISADFNCAYKYDNISKEIKSNSYQSPEQEEKTTIGYGIGLNYHF